MNTIQPLSDSDRKSKYLKQLQNEDFQVNDIIGEASHVEMYQFDLVSNKWTKKGVAGTTFVVQRSTSPIYRIVVINKQGPDNFILDVSKIIKTKVQSPYIMAKCSTEDAPIILGLWIHDDDTRQQLMDVIARCRNALKNSPPVPEAAGAPLPKAKVTVTPPPPLAQAASAVAPPAGIASGTTKKGKAAKAASNGDDFLTDREISAKKGSAAGTSATAVTVEPTEIGALAKQRLLERLERQQRQQQQEQQGSSSSGGTVPPKSPKSPKAAASLSPPSSSPSQILRSAIIKPQPEPVRTPLLRAEGSAASSKERGRQLSIMLNPSGSGSSSGSCIAHGVDRSLLLAPSDITGVRRNFIKRQ